MHSSSYRGSRGLHTPFCGGASVQSDQLFWRNDGEHDAEIARFVLEGDDYVNDITSRAVKQLIRATEGRHRSFASAVFSDAGKDRGAAVQAIYLNLSDDQYLRYECERAFDEIHGEQFMRGPAMVDWERRGTCSDLTLLFLSCLANVKLWPVYVQIRLFDAHDTVDHALAATWLDPPRPNRDPFLGEDEARRAVREHDLLLLDCTGFVDGCPNRQYKLSFDEAKEEAERLLAESCLRFALDVRRAWENGIAPVRPRLEFP